MDGLVSISPPGPVPGPNPPPYRFAEVYLFDTCTHKCGYCWLAESGQVLDMDQLKPYRDPAFLDRFTSFFVSRTSAESKWLVQLAGGEPLIAPNLDRLCDPLLEAGNRICVYTALLVGDNHPGLRYLLRRSAPGVDYVMASFHPEAELDEKAWFDRLRMLKDAGHRVFLRFVGHPARLHRLDELSDRARELDICFFPTTLLSRRYPQAYSEAEAERLSAHFSSASQHIQFRGGLDTTGLRCYGGSRVIAINMQTGNITPCTTVSGPLLGNLFENRLEMNHAPIVCPEPGRSCICEMHFQQNVIEGAAEDHHLFERQMQGFTPPDDCEAALADIERRGIAFFREQSVGMGQVEDDTRLSYTADEIRERFRKARDLPRLPPRGPVREIPDAILQLRNGHGSLEPGSPTRIVTGAELWSYAAAISIAFPPGPGPYWVKVRANVVRGAVGFGVLTRDGKAFQDRCQVGAGNAPGVVHLLISDPANADSLVIQNANGDGDSELELGQVSLLAGA